MKCWFCKIRDAADKHVLSFEMYGDVDARKTPSETKVAYNVRHLEVPRCGDCRERHRHASVALILSVIITLALLAAVLASIFAWTAPWLWAGGIGLTAGLLVAAILTRSTLLKGTQSILKAKKTYPEVKELCDKGYKFGKRPKDTPPESQKDDEET